MMFNARPSIDTRNDIMPKDQRLICIYLDFL